MTGPGSEQLKRDIQAEVKRVSELFRLILKYREHFQASGIEFSGLREYLPSDDASRIDWKSSARLNNLYVKEYDEEKNLDTFIILDSSQSMMTGTADKLKSEYAATLAATLAYASVDTGINVGFALSSGESEVFISPDKGMAQYHVILEQMTEFENHGGRLDLEDVLDDVLERIKPNTTVFVISDFIELEGDWESKIKLASNKFRHLMGVMVRDLRDHELPEDGNIRLESPGGAEQMVVNTDSVRKEFEEEAKKQEESVKKAFTEGGASFIKIDTRDSFAAEFASYFDQGADTW